MNTSNLRDIYVQKAISQIPRLLSLQDRNPFSPTFGCFNREYWLCKTLDFPSAIAQFGVHSLALVYANDFAGNIYFKNKKILEWLIAGIEYWIKIQKKDGSFDEFYPNERGWAGPTGFLLYAMLDSYRMLKGDFPKSMEDRFLKAVHKSAFFLAKYDESGVLANHHAMAILPIYEAYLVLNDKKILDGFKVRKDAFLSYCYEEGWCLEYDGADLGYLSATVSFLGKLHKVYQDEDIYRVIKKAIEFSSYFVYPDGFYAGTIGSRQTLHFYPHGYEILSRQIPLAAVIADKMLAGLAEGKLVPPEIQEDRYFLYRIPEFLLSYFEYKERAPADIKIPYERDDFTKYFPHARMYIRKAGNCYSLSNMAKGATTKTFDIRNKKMLLSDCGITVKLDNGKIAITQDINNDNEVKILDKTIIVEGDFHFAKFTFFTPFKMLVFRIVMLALGWQMDIAYHLKGLIRKMLILSYRPAPLRFYRKIEFFDSYIDIQDTITIRANYKREVRRCLIGDEIAFRYVPQSRYFQSLELETEGIYLSNEEISRLNKNQTITIKRHLDMENGKVGIKERA